LSVRHCLSLAFRAFGDNWFALASLSGGYFLLDRALLVVQQQDAEGWLGTLATAGGILVGAVFMAASTVASDRVARGFRVDRQIWGVTFRFLPAMFRLFLLFLVPIVVFSIPIYVAADRMAGQGGPTDLYALPALGLLLLPFVTVFAFAPWAIIEGEGARAALKTSWRLVKGHLGKITLFALIFSIELASFGLTINQGIWDHLNVWVQDMVLIPITNLALAFAYLHLRHQAPPDGESPNGLSANPLV
jgi:hypothetical protein